MCLPNIMSEKRVGDRYSVTICHRPRHSKWVPAHTFRPPLICTLRPILVIAYWCKGHIYRFRYIVLLKPIHFWSITRWRMTCVHSYICSLLSHQSKFFPLFTQYFYQGNKNGHQGPKKGQQVWRFHFGEEFRAFLIRNSAFFPWKMVIFRRPLQL